MPQIRAEGRQARLDVDAVAIPTNQRLDRHRVPEVVQPGRKRRVSPHACVLAEASERGLDGTRVEPCSAQRHEEARVEWMRAELIAPARVARQRFQGAVVQGHVARLPNFDSRTSSTASVQSMSVRSSLIASLIRMPVAASSPISVS